MFIKKQSSSWTGWFKNSVMFLCLLAFFIMPIANILSVNPALAADPGIFERLKPEEKYKFFQYATAMSYCFSGKSHGPDGGFGLGFKVHRNPSKELKDNIIFNDKKWDNLVDPVRLVGRVSPVTSFFIGGAEAAQYSTVYVFTGTMTGDEAIKGYDKGSVECTSKEFQQMAFEQFKISPNELLCQMGYRKDGHKNASQEECVAGNSWFTQEALPGGDGRANFINALSALTGYPTNLENNDPYIKYRKYQDWIAGCVNGGQVSKPSNGTWTIPTVSEDGKVVDTYQIKGSLDYMWDSTTVGYKGKQKFLCTDIISQLKTAANEYAKSLKDAAIKNACSTFTGKELEACKDGIEHKGDSTYCETKYKGRDKEINACKQGQSAEIETPSEGDGGEEEGKNSCGVDGIGWLVCPLMSFAGSLGDASYSAISYFLSIDKGIFKDQENGGLEQAWKFFRDIANAVFAVIFLWVIFSQISNVGVSNYGIKKILPRLIIGALLVNLSFYLCQLAVDLSNILGFSLKGVLEGAASKVGTQSAEVGTFNTFIIGGIALVGVGLFIFLAVSIPTLLALLLALIVVLVILIVRQAAVILLIAISPLAFAAWLLPNTENLFKKWVSMFRGLLIVFPVISLLYGAGKLAGAVLAASATDDPNNPKETMQLAALAASILPLGATPFVLKSSLNSLGSFAGKLGGLSGLANKKLGSAIANKSRISDARNAWKSLSAKKLAERRSGNTGWGRAASDLRKKGNPIFMRGLGVAMNPAAALDNTPFGRKLGLGDGASAAQEAYDKAAMEKAERALTYQHGGDAVAALKDKNADKYIRIAAVNQLKGQGTYGADKIAEYLGAGGKVDSVSMAKSLTDMKGSHAGVAEAGAEALQALQKKDGPSEIKFSSDQFNSFTASGVGKLSNKDIARQSANAIQNSNITADQATEILSDDILYSSANNAVKSALMEKGGERIIPQTPQDNQNDQQGDNSQQSSQNNQQSNSSSGGIIIPSDEEVNKYGR